MKKLVFHIVTLLICLNNAFAQHKLNNLASSFRDFHAKYSFEEVYINIDKPYHAAGEDMYMTVYHLDASTHTLLKEQSFIFLCLVHPDGRSVLVKKVRTNDGLVNTHLVLPDTLSTGQYELHAYSPWMMNFSSTPLFKSPLWIEGLNQVLPADCNKLEIKLDVEKNLIDRGIPSTLTIQLFNNCNQLINAEVQIKNAKHDLLSQMQPDKYGLVSIDNFDLNDEPYSIEVDGYESLSFSLNDYLNSIQSEIVIKDYDDSRLRVEVYLAEKYRGQQFYLISHARALLNLSVEGKAEKALTGFLIPKAQLKEGLNIFSLFSENLELLVEQGFFVKPLNTVSISWENPESNFKSRSLNQLQFKLSNPVSEIHSARLSASVYKKIESGHSSPNIVSDLLLHSQLSLPVNFNLSIEDDISGLLKINNVFNSGFDKVLDGNSDKSITIAEHPQFDIISGRINHKVIGTPTADSVLILSVRAKNSGHYTAKTDALGNFQFVVPKIHGDAQLFFSLKYASMGDYEIQLTENEVERNYGHKHALTYQNATSDYYHSFLQKNYLANIFDDDDCSDRSLTTSTEAFSSYDAVFDLNEYNLPATVEEVIVDILSGLKVRREKGSKVVSVLKKVGIWSDAYYATMPGKSFLMIDGVYVNDDQYFLAMKPDKIESISMIHSEYIFEETTFAGIVSVKTKEADTDLFQSGSGLSFQYSGYNESDDFRNLPCAPSRDVKIPDFRHLLVWEPNLVSERDGSFSFFVQTSDEEGPYVLRIEGITEDGIPFFKEFDFTVAFDK